jgi:hypothetical protein
MPGKRLQVFIVAGAIALIVLHLIRPSLGIDSVTLGLLIVAFLPWLLTFVASAEFPGGWKLKFRELEKKLDDQQEVINQVVLFSMAHHLFRHLTELHARSKTNEEYLFRSNEIFKRDLLFLRDHGFIESTRPGHYLNIDDLVGERTRCHSGRQSRYPSH